MSDKTVGKLVVITGANSGIGKAAAVKFAAEGWQVVMACRSLEKGERARREIVASSGNSAVQLMQVDMSSFASIRRFCADFCREHAKLDVLIHNAAYFNHGITTYQLSPDGWELTFATNVFGPLLMTELLRERLAAAEDPRVLHAGSTNIKHFFDPKRQIEFDNLRGECADTRRYAVYKMYGDSKMGLLLLTCRMADEYRAQGIKTYMVMTPATRVSQETLRKFSGHYRLIGPIVQNINPLALTPEQMAACYYRICASEEFRNVTGVLVDSKCCVIAPAGDKPATPFSVIGELLHTRHMPAYVNGENSERMWSISREAIGIA